jgi:hypothetical protein
MTGEPVWITRTTRPERAHRPNAATAQHKILIASARIGRVRRGIGSKSRRWADSRVADRSSGKSPARRSRLGKKDGIVPNAAILVAAPPRHHGLDDRTESRRDGRCDRHFCCPVHAFGSLKLPVYGLNLLVHKSFGVLAPTPGKFRARRGCGPLTPGRRYRAGGNMLQLIF